MMMPWLSTTGKMTKDKRYLLEAIWGEEVKQVEQLF